MVRICEEGRGGAWILYCSQQDEKMMKRKEDLARVNLLCMTYYFFSVPAGDKRGDEDDGDGVIVCF